MRWLIRSFLALVLLGLLAGAALFLIPTEKVAQVAADRFTALTGRQLVIEGSVRPTIWPTLGVRTGPVSISNADWSKEGPMLRADGLEIGLDMAALWGGSVRITGIRAEAPRILLERARDGRENWIFEAPGSTGGSGGSAGAGGASARKISLDLAEFSGGSFVFLDHRTGARVAMEAMEGTVRIPDFAGAVTIAVAGEMNGQTAKLDLKLAEFAPFLEGRLVGMEADLRAGDATIGFSGRGGFAPMGLSGTLNADLGDLGALSRLAGMARPALPAGLGAQKVALGGALTVTEKASLHLRGATVTLDGNRFSADADLATGGDRPKLSAKVSAGALDLRGLTGGATGGGSGGGSGGGIEAEGWPTDRIDVSGLGLMDAEIALTAESLDLGALKFGQTRILATIDRARAVFELRQVSAYDGTIAGQFVVNGRGGLSVGGDLTLSGLSMQPLLIDLGGYDRLLGRADLSLRFLGVGNSVDAIMRSLSGAGQVGFGKGELRGLDIAGMLRNLDPNYVGAGQKTIFDSISARFDIDKGVLRNDDLALKAPYITATGQGEVGIGARNLNYRIRPTALASTDGSGGVMVPLWITGSWSDPTYRLDLESLAKERLEEEAKALEARAKAEAKEAEARAKAELERKAQEELGIERQEGESLEDAAKRRAQEVLEEEAAKALQRLLGQP